MSKKIIGATVGTPISPKTIKDKLKPVQTVNGVKPDENGNVNVEVETIQVDSAFSATSENPLQNKVITECIQGLELLIGEEIWPQLTPKVNASNNGQILQVKDGKWVPADAELSGDGEGGKDGISPTIDVSAITGGHRLTITDVNGTEYVDVMDGEKGDTGPQGIQGPKGDTGAQGPKGDTGSQGAKGDKGDKGDTGATGSAGKDGTNGKDGTSVTVKSVSESSADGGSNVVTFSDGNTVTIKNGSKGSKGDQGIQGVQGEKGADGAKGDKGDKGDTGSTGATGATGQRGTGILKVTTTPTSYTTTTNGIAPIKRMSISTITKEAGVSEVLVGDCVSHSYYLYRIYYLDATYAYMDKSQSIRGSSGAAGAAGTSVTVTNVSESTADGGSNVVTFSDGNTVTIKNGSKGSTGDKGDKGDKGDTGPAYTLTSSDKSSIAAAVKASLTTENWTFTLEDGSTVTKAVYVG